MNWDPPKISKRGKVKVQNKEKHMFVFRVLEQQTGMVREYTMEQQIFLVQRKLAGATLAVIQQEYAYWWPVNTWHVISAPAPNTTYPKQ